MVTGRFRLLGLMFLVPLSLHAQGARTLRGRVLSAADSSGLSRVRVQVLGSVAATVSDRSGNFVLRGLPSGELRIAFERIGLVADTIRVAGNQATLIAYVNLSAVPLHPVEGVPIPIARKRFESVSQTSTVTLSPKEITNTPTLAEPDIARVVQLLPGTVAKNDFNVGFNVRGGESDQNLILLDGVQIFNPSHLGGLFSTFDNAAVDHVDFLTGGFPARFGGRLSSVMDVKLRDGNPSSTDVHGNLSLLSAKVLLEGPIGKSDISYMIGGRRTYADLVVAPFREDGFPYYFGDAVGKVTVPLGTGGVVQVTGYVGRDALDLPFIDAEPGRDGIDLEFDWGNRLVGLHFRQPLGDLVLEQHLSASGFSTSLGLEPDVRRLENSSRVLTARTALALSPGQPNEIRVGVGVEDYSMDLTINSKSLEINDLSLESHPTVISGFIDDQWRPFQWLLLRPGVRVERVSGGADFTGVSPRASVKIFVTDNLALTGSAGRFYQPIHSIRDQELPVTLFDFWIGADEETPVARSNQFVFGFEQWFSTQISLKVEGFTKTFDDLVFQNPADDPKVKGDEFMPATGYARGVDVLLRKHTGEVTGWVSYSLARTMRNSNGQRFPPAHDRRHTLNVVLQTRGPLGSQMGARWGYGSPLPFTGITGQWLHRQYSARLNTFNRVNDEAISTTINARRFPFYSRLDLSFRWEYEKWGATWHPYLQLVNAFNRTNVWVYTFDFERAPPTRTGFSQLPIIPTIGVDFEW